MTNLGILGDLGYQEALQTKITCGSKGECWERKVKQIDGECI